MTLYNVNFKSIVELHHKFTFSTLNNWEVIQQKKKFICSFWRNKYLQSEDIFFAFFQKEIPSQASSCGWDQIFDTEGITIVGPIYLQTLLWSSTAFSTSASCTSRESNPFVRSQSVFCELSVDLRVRVSQRSATNTKQLSGNLRLQLLISTSFRISFATFFHGSMRLSLSHCVPIFACFSKNWVPNC